MLSSRKSRYREVVPLTSGVRQASLSQDQWEMQAMCRRGPSRKEGDILCHLFLSHNTHGQSWPSFTVYHHPSIPQPALNVEVWGFPSCGFIFRPSVQHIWLSGLYPQKGLSHGGKWSSGEAPPLPLLKCLATKLSPQYRSDTINISSAGYVEDNMSYVQIKSLSYYSQVYGWMQNYEYARALSFGTSG